MRRLIAPALFGLVGASILIGLGLWQLQRLQWKEGILAEITARIEAAPSDLPDAPDPARDRFLPVHLTGSFLPGEIHVLVSRKQIGAGYRIIAPFNAGGNVVMVDRGFVLLDQKDTARPATATEVTGNLHWPDEVDGYTPEPDLARNIWFARDVAAMAAASNTEPVLVIARDPTGDGVEPMPVTIEGIPNDHLQYAITWFSLALVWLGMTAFLLWRISRRNE